ncbi:hypothetical protein LSAT2_022759 [Lamellibrachia satsuma]|nr:hypothetical protein LSAT2_022759 [Lamellibrachia satsuma]
MKLLLLSLAIVAFAASDDKREMLLLKRLLNTIEGSETRDSAKRYLYQSGHHQSPFTDASRPGEMWLDLQMDENVMTKCPNCRFFVVFQCVSANCHDNQVRRFPHDGFDWEAFIAQFASLGSYNGMWVPGLEKGKTYTVWDVVTLPDRHTQFNGYTNNERKTVVIP